MPIFSYAEVFRYREQRLGEVIEQAINDALLVAITKRESAPLVYCLSFDVIQLRVFHQIGIMVDFYRVNEVCMSAENPWIVEVNTGEWLGWKFFPDTERVSDSPV